MPYYLHKLIIIIISIPDIIYVGNDYEPIFRYMLILSISLHLKKETLSTNSSYRSELYEGQFQVMLPADSFYFILCVIMGQQKCVLCKNMI